MTDFKIGDSVYVEICSRSYVHRSVKYPSDPMTVTRETKTLWITDEGIEGRLPRRWPKPGFRRYSFPKLKLYDDEARALRLVYDTALECDDLIHRFCRMDKVEQLVSLLRDAVNLLEKDEK